MKSNFAPRSFASPNRYIHVNYDVFKKIDEEKAILKRAKKHSTKFLVRVSKKSY